MNNILIGIPFFFLLSEGINLQDLWKKVKLKRKEINAIGGN